MAIEQNVLRSCVALKLITNGLDMAHDMREQRRGATGPHDDDARANSCTDDGTPAPAHDDDTCTDDDTPSRRMTMIRHMKMMHMRIHAQTMVHLHPRVAMTQAQTMMRQNAPLLRGTLNFLDGWPHNRTERKNCYTMY